MRQRARRARQNRFERIKGGLVSHIRLWVLTGNGE
jgi:hypothetical protein